MSKQINVVYPEVPNSHPAYPLYLATIAAMAGIPWVLLKSEGPRAIHLASWCDGQIETGVEIEQKTPTTGEYVRSEAGKGNDYLTLVTPYGYEICLSATETFEFVETLEIMLGKRSPTIVIPHMIPPNAGNRH